jgi:hypothetical protein
MGMWWKTGVLNYLSGGHSLGFLRNVLLFESLFKRHDDEGLTTKKGYSKYLPKDTMIKV